MVRASVHHRQGPRSSAGEGSRRGLVERHIGHVILDGTSGAMPIRAKFREAGRITKKLQHAQVVKQIRGYGADEWEIFTREWQQGLAPLHGYHEVKRLGGAGDHGRDVIGLCTPAACEGEWDNYQCKNYEGMLQTPRACRDAGKIIFHSFRGVFKPPRSCRFVAPKGPSMDLRDMLLNPSKFRAEMIKTWNTRVAGHVVEKQKHLLQGDLADYVNEYDFKTFGYTTLDEMLDAHRLTAYWAQRFGGLLPPPNPGVTPETMAPHETVYVGKLLDVYAEAAASEITCVDDLEAHGDWKADLQRQRVRFFDAEAFMANLSGSDRAGDYGKLCRGDFRRYRTVPNRNRERGWRGWVRPSLLRRRRHPLVFWHRRRR